MESTPAQAAEGVAVVRVLAAVLERLVAANTHLAKSDPGQVTKFHALKAPGISILQYLERIHKYASCSTECFILALIYIDRLIQRNNFLLTELNVHRVIITAILLAAKFFDDAYYNNAYYAKVGGVLVTEMNSLEVEFLFRINFSLHVTSEVFSRYHAELISHAVGTPDTSALNAVLANASKRVFGELSNESAVSGPSGFPTKTSSKSKTSLQTRHATNEGHFIRKQYDEQIMMNTNIAEVTPSPPPSVKVAPPPLSAGSISSNQKWLSQSNTSVEAVAYPITRSSSEGVFQQQNISAATLANTVTHRYSHQIIYRHHQFPYDQSSAHPRYPVINEGLVQQQFGGNFEENCSPYYSAPPGSRIVSHTYADVHPAVNEVSPATVVVHDTMLQNNYFIGANGYQKVSIPNPQETGYCPHAASQLQRRLSAPIRNAGGTQTHLMTGYNVY